MRKFSVQTLELQESIERLQLKRGPLSAKTGVNKRALNVLEVDDTSRRKVHARQAER